MNYWLDPLAIFADNACANSPADTSSVVIVEHNTCSGCYRTQQSWRVGSFVKKQTPYTTITHS